MHPKGEQVVIEVGGADIQWCHETSGGQKVDEHAEGSAWQKILRPFIVLSVQRTEGRNTNIIGTDQHELHVSLLAFPSYMGCN